MSEFTNYLLYAIIQINALLLAIGVHEWAHAFVAYKQGDPTAKTLGRMTIAPHAHFDIFGFLCLYLFGFGWAKPVPIDYNNLKHGKKSRTLVALAGIIANFTFGTLLIILRCALLKFAPNYYVAWGLYGKVLENFLVVTIQMNFVLLFFNILPIYPLDGFRVVETFAKPNSKYVDFMSKFSFVFLFFFILFTAVLDYYFTYTAGYTIYGIEWIFFKIFGLQ